MATSGDDGAGKSNLPEVDDSLNSAAQVETPTVVHSRNATVETEPGSPVLTTASTSIKMEQPDTVTALSETDAAATEVSQSPGVPVPSATAAMPTNLPHHTSDTTRPTVPLEQSKPPAARKGKHFCDRNLFGEDSQGPTPDTQPEVTEEVERNLTANNFQEHTITERESYLQRAFGQYFDDHDGDEEREHKDFYDDGVDVRCWKTCRDTTFYDAETNESLTSDVVTGLFGIERNRHMSCLWMSVYYHPGKSEHDLKDDSDSQSEDYQDTDETIRKRYAKRAIIRVNYQAITHIRAMGLSDEDDKSRLDVEDQEINAWPQHMHDVIQKYKEDGRRPVLIELKFDLDHASIENVFIGSGTWVEPFARSISQGRIRAIMFGTETTVQKLKIMSHLFDHEKIYNPLDLFHAPDRRRVVKFNHLILPEIALKSGTKQTQWDFVTQRSFFGWDEYITVFAIGMATEHAVREDKVLDYERHSKTLRLMSIPGSDGNAFYGTLPVAEEDGIQLSPGTRLQITFSGANRPVAAAFLKPQSPATSDSPVDHSHSTVQEKSSGHPTPGEDHIYAPQSHDEAESSDESTDDLEDHQATVEDATELEPEIDAGKMEESKEHLQPKKHLKSKKERNKAWSATVIQPSGFCPIDQVPILVTRLWMKSANGQCKEWDPRIVKQIASANLETFELMRAFHEDSGQPVKVKLKEDKKVFYRNLASLERLNHAPRDYPPTEWNTRMKELLPGNRAHTHDTMDMYQHLRTEFAHPELMMQLNHAQKTAVQAGKFARQGIQIIQGVGGSGKSHFASEVVNLHAQSSGNHGVLIMAPQNKAVDTLAITASLRLQALQTARKVSPNVYYIREFSDGAESQILKHVANETRPRGTKSRPAIATTGNDAIHSISEVQEILRDTWNMNKVSARNHITDKRVLAAMHLSVGVRMLQTAGVNIPGLPDSEIACANPVQFEGFRVSYREYAKGANWEKEQYDNFEVNCKRLKEYVISRATAWFVTTTHAGSHSLQKIIQDRVSMIMLDEAGREREDNLFPILATGFSQNPTIMMFGDLRQLAPVAHRNGNNPFIKQLNIPLMSRLISLGWECVFFHEQHRMVPDISKMVNFLMYDGTLRDAPTTKLVNRPQAQKFRETLQAWTNRKVASNVIFLDLKKSPLTRAVVLPSKSRHNELNVIIMIKIVARLVDTFPNASIGLVTGYMAQKGHLLSAVANMRLRKTRGVENISVATFDAAQGDQFDIVVMDLTIGDNAGFLTDKKRLTVAATRARDGLIIVGCSEDIKKFERPDTHFLRIFVRYLKRFRAQLEDTRKFPKCAFFTPGRLSHTDSIWATPIHVDSSFRGADVLKDVHDSPEDTETVLGDANASQSIDHQSHLDMDPKLRSFITEFLEKYPGNDNASDDDILHTAAGAFHEASKQVQDYLDLINDPPLAQKVPNETETDRVRRMEHEQHFRLTEDTSMELVKFKCADPARLDMKMDELCETYLDKLKADMEEIRVWLNRYTAPGAPQIVFDFIVDDDEDADVVAGSNNTGPEAAPINAGPEAAPNTAGTQKSWDSPGPDAAPINAGTQESWGNDGTQTNLDQADAPEISWGNTNEAPSNTAW